MLPASPPVSEALAETDELGAGAARQRTGSSDESEIPSEADVDDIGEAIRLMTCFQPDKSARACKTVQ
eukprot:8809239-Lingulodinium_polyedra.AAC.1